MLVIRPESFVTAEEFKTAFEAGKCPPMRKELAGAEVVKANIDGSVDFILSTATPDRSNDVVNQDGWDTANFSKNPVMLWAHDYAQPPVGKPGALSLDGGRLMARGCTFPERDLYEFGWMVGQMYAKGFLHAVSVGFRPTVMAYNKERGDYAMDFQKQELLEFSAVPVPANPEALVAAKAAGIPLAPLIDWAERVLDAHGSEKSAKLIVPREYVEKMRAMARAPTVYSAPAAKADAPQDIPAEPVEPTETPGETGDCSSCLVSCEACADAVEALSGAVEVGADEDVATACDECAAACVASAKASDSHGEECAGLAASMRASAAAAFALAAACRAAFVEEEIPEEPLQAPAAESTQSGVKVSYQATDSGALSKAVADETRKQLAALGL